MSSIAALSVVSKLNFAETKTSLFRRSFDRAVKISIKF